MNTEQQAAADQTPHLYEKMLAEQLECILCDKFGPDLHGVDAMEMATFVVGWMVTAGNAARVAAQARARFWSRGDNTQSESLESGQQND